MFPRQSSIFFSILVYKNLKKISYYLKKKSLIQFMDKNWEQIEVKISDGSKNPEIRNTPGIGIWIPETQDFCNLGIFNTEFDNP